MGDIEDLEGVCRAVMDLDPRMRSARIINSRGHLEAGGMRSGLESLEEKKHDEMMFMELVLRVRMRHEFDAELGRVNFSMSHRERVVLMSFPLAGDGVLLASGEKDIDFKSIPFRILDIIGPLRDTDRIF